VGRYEEKGLLLQQFAKTYQAEIFDVNHFIFKDKWVCYIFIDLVSYKDYSIEEIMLNHH